MFPIGNLVPALALDKIGRRWTMICGCIALSICMMMIAALLSNGNPATSSASIAFFFLYMLIFGGTINVVPWVYVRNAPGRVVCKHVLTMANRVPRSYRLRREREALPFRSLPIGCGTSVSALLMGRHMPQRERLPVTTCLCGQFLTISTLTRRFAVIVMISPVLINRIQWRTYLLFMALLVNRFPPILTLVTTSLTCGQAVFAPAIWWFYPETSNLSLEDIDIIFLPKEMGGLDGNARIRLTPQMAAEHQAEAAAKDGEAAAHLEKTKDASAH